MLFMSFSFTMCQYYVLFGVAIYEMFYPLLQLGVGPTIFPQRPGQIECDVSIH